MQPIEIYHYTSLQHVENILQSKKIKLGSILGKDRSLIHDNAISLTTDVDPNGHGLPDGRKINVELSKIMGHIVEKNGDLLSYNKKKVRIKINTKNLKLIKCSVYYEHDKELFMGLTIGGYYPYGTNNNVTKEELLHCLSISKADSWYYCFQEIPDSEILAIEYL